MEKDSKTQEGKLQQNNNRIHEQKTPHQNKKNFLGFILVSVNVVQSTEVTY